MKKLIALFVVVFLFAVVAQAQVDPAGTTWDSGNETAEFTAEILCIPTFEITQSTGDLGNFFTSDAADNYPVTATFTTAITGPDDADASYTISYTINGVIPGGSMNFDGNYPVTNMATDVAAWDTDFPSTEAPTDCWLSGAWSLTGGDATTGFISCNTADPINLVYTASALNVQNLFTGTATFTVLATMAVTI
jgi:hypothetical protein